jgi:hypothetical protein
MKRYLVFAYDQYYPAGGWGDFQAAFDSLDEAKSCADGLVLDKPGAPSSSTYNERYGYAYSEVVDLDSREAVYP